MQATLAKLAEIREKNPETRIVFCSGGFDLTHAGHAIFLEECKKRGDLLVVGIGPDEIIKKEKGEDRPVLNESVRLKLVSSLKPVDHAFIIPIINVPRHLDHLRPVFSKLKPNVYVVNSDIVDTEDRVRLLDDYGTELVQLDRECPATFEQISTTKIIEKIKKLA
ncbi:MAG: adenylyltransferase/cytidyltransferase family protein [Deltaproteobacteria bacterium]|nr:adenylyltransferase/cytidyltransferase family protein [Deltaproteobacteria bacterium]